MFFGAMLSTIADLLSQARRRAASASCDPPAAARCHRPCQRRGWAAQPHLRRLPPLSGPPLQVNRSARRAQAYRKKMMAVERWMGMNALPRRLQRRIRTFYAEVGAPPAWDQLV